MLGTIKNKKGHPIHNLEAIDRNFSTLPSSSCVSCLRFHFCNSFKLQSSINIHQYSPFFFCNTFLNYRLSFRLSSFVPFQLFISPLHFIDHMSSWRRTKTNKNAWIILFYFFCNSSFYSKMICFYFSIFGKLFTHWKESFSHNTA